MFVLSRWMLRGIVGLIGIVFICNTLTLLLGYLLPSPGTLDYWANLNPNTAPYLCSIDLRTQVIDCGSRMDAVEFPILSPDGRQQLLCLNGDIYIRDMFSGVQQALMYTPNRGEYEPQWSPDGSEILYTAFNEGYYDLFVVRADEGSPRLLLAMTGDQSDAVWSPDGERIAFRHTHRYRNEIWVINADGTNPYLVANAQVAGNLVWSPDSQQIAFSDVGMMGYEIFFADINQPGVLLPFDADHAALFPENWR